MGGGGGGQVDSWKVAWMGEGMDGCVGRWMDTGMDDREIGVYTDRWMDEWVSMWVDGWMDREMAGG